MAMTIDTWCQWSFRCCCCCCCNKWYCISIKMYNKMLCKIDDCNHLLDRASKYIISWMWMQFIQPITITLEVAEFMPISRIIKLHAAHIRALMCTFRIMRESINLRNAWNSHDTAAAAAAAHYIWDGKWHRLPKRNSPRSIAFWSWFIDLIWQAKTFNSWTGNEPILWVQTKRLIHFSI